MKRSLSEFEIPKTFAAASLLSCSYDSAGQHPNPQLDVSFSATVLHSLEFMVIEGSQMKIVAKPSQERAFKSYADVVRRASEKRFGQTN
jgi:hypothetical protein